jgi:hypothetical protein
MNAATNTLTLYPYLLSDTWVFDDARTCLHEEAFVLGATEAITKLIAIKQIPNAESGFSLTFGGEAFEGHDAELQWLKADPSGSGNWYATTLDGEYHELWLCPALFCYFESAPKKIFVKAAPLPEGVNPHWTPSPGDDARRFVEAPQQTK